jgi:hypothetical protein
MELILGFIGLIGVLCLVILFAGTNGYNGWLLDRHIEKLRKEYARPYKEE